MQVTTVKLSPRIIATVSQIDPRKVVVKSNQRVAGGGNRNMLHWALAARSKGFKSMHVTIPGHKFRDPDLLDKLLAEAHNATNLTGIDVRVSPRIGE